MGDASIRLHALLGEGLVNVVIGRIYDIPLMPDLTALKKWGVKHNAVFPKPESPAATLDSSMSTKIECQQSQQ